MFENTLATLRADQIQPGDRILDRPAGWPTLVTRVRHDTGLSTITFDNGDDGEDAGDCTFVDYQPDRIVSIIVGPNHPEPNKATTVDECVTRIRYTIGALTETAGHSELGGYVRGQISGLYLALSAICDQRPDRLRADKPPLPVDPVEKARLRLLRDCAKVQKAAIDAIEGRAS